MLLVDEKVFMFVEDDVAVSALTATWRHSPEAMASRCDR